MPRALGVLEPRVLLEERKVHRTDWAVASLGQDDLGLPFDFGPLNLLALVGSDRVVKAVSHQCLVLSLFSNRVCCLALKGFEVGIWGRG